MKRLFRTRLVNRTPHDVRVIDPDSTFFDPYTRRTMLLGDLEDATRLLLRPEGRPIRCRIEEDEVGELVDGTPLVVMRPVEILGLPEFDPSVRYVVSASVLMEAKRLGRNDFCAPARMVYDRHGRICGCCALGVSGLSEGETVDACERDGDAAVEHCR